MPKISENIAIGQFFQSRAFFILAAISTQFAPATLNFTYDDICFSRKCYSLFLFLLQKNTFQFLIASNGSASYGIWLFKTLETSGAFLGYSFGSPYCREQFPYTNQQLLQMRVIVRLLSHCSNSTTTTRLPFTNSTSRPSTNFTELSINFTAPTGPTPTVRSGQQSA